MKGILNGERIVVFVGLNKAQKLLNKTFTVVNTDLPGLNYIVTAIQKKYIFHLQGKDKLLVVLIWKR